jgi:hypothetical protein
MIDEPAQRTYGLNAYLNQSFASEFGVSSN